MLQTLKSRWANIFHEAVKCLSFNSRYILCVLWARFADHCILFSFKFCTQSQFFCNWGYISVCQIWSHKSKTLPKKWRDFSTSCKPFINPKTRKDKSTSSSTFLNQVKPRSSETRMMERKKHGECLVQLMIWNQNATCKTSQCDGSFSWVYIVAL